jgi:hypothetical protein
LMQEPRPLNQTPHLSWPDVPGTFATGSIPKLCPGKRENGLHRFFFCGMIPIAVYWLSEGDSMSRKSLQDVMKALNAVGPMLPGSISQQWNVCGKAGCRCKDPHRPKRHGPYYQLSFTLSGRSSTLFLRPEDVAVARQCVRRYRLFRQLSAKLAAAYVEQARRIGVAALIKCR